MANSQDIEARLCAYVDGDLNPEMRTEIERHLDAHPQHRRMIRDLMQTRQLVCALPRFAAPADLGEGLQGQLERSMLLGSKDEAHHPWRAWMRRVPQAVALASVLAMALGLSSVIYMLLRAADRTPQATAIASPAPLPAEPLSVPTTEPAVVTVNDAAPTTQPVEVAMTPDADTTPDTADVADDNDLPDDGFDMTQAPATQPADLTASAAIPAAATDMAAPAATQPDTQPVADNADDK